MKLTRKEAIDFLKIPEKIFDNYHKKSREIKGFKENNRWYFDKNDLIKWENQKNSRTVYLTLDEYKKCFNLAVKMAYSSKLSTGTNIRVFKSEVQMVEDLIFSIIAKYGVKKFLNQKFNTAVCSDLDFHPGNITHDLTGIYINGDCREIKIGVTVKSNKIKSCFNIINPNEYKNSEIKSDVYIFARVGLPSDHLFRIFKDHYFFKDVVNVLEDEDGFRKIKKLNKISVWICGFSYHDEFEKVNKIPGQKFNGYRYVKSVAEMHNSNESWENLIKRF